MSDDQGNQPSGGDAGTERALDELRAALEQLASRMGAGFREDLAQIRAIAASVAERDLTAEVEALRVDVATLVGRDTSNGVRDELTAVRSELARLASGDDLAGVRAELAPLQASLDRVSSRLDDDSGRTQVLARFEALEARLDQLTGPAGNEEVLTRLDALAARLGDGHGNLLEQLQDNLADVASGEAVGALWDEVRQLRTDLPDLVAGPQPAPSSTSDPGLVAVTDELAGMRGVLEELRGAPATQIATIRDLVASELEAAREAMSVRLDAASEDTAVLVASIVDRTEAPAVASATIDPATVELLLGEIRAAGAGEDALVDALRAEVDGVRQLLGEVRTAAGQTTSGGGQDGSEQLDAIQASIEDLKARLDEGLVLDEGVALPASGTAADDPGLEAIADQIAALRDFLATELDTVHQTVSARLDAAAESTAASVAAMSSGPEPEPAVAATPSALDADTVDLLRDEIRAAGAIGDQVVDALREELKALRRRIAVKAGERVLDDRQLAQIADAVAARLAAGGDDV